MPRRPSPSSIRRDPRFRPDIQGLRAVAVLAVLGYHAGIPGFGGGYLGVDVFFVISGYLIGGHLLRELAGRGRIRFAAFYARRARRIAPASLVVIALTVVASLVATAPLRAPEIAMDAVWASLSAANVRFAVLGTDYLANVTPSPLQHYWSLGVEEQFYVVVPLVLVGLFAVARRRSGTVLAAGIALTAGSFALCLAWGAASPWTYFSLPARAWELGVGILAAAAAARFSRLGGMPRQVLGGVAAAALVGSVALGSIPGFPHPGLGTLLPVLATAALILAGEPGASTEPSANAASPARAAVVPAVSRALSVRPAVFLGTISFSLYLVHWPLLALAHENSNSEAPLPLGIRVALAVLSVPLAWLLWRGVEQPFLRRRREPARARGPILVAGATAVALAVSLTAAAPALAARHLSSDRTASAGVEFRPAGTAFVPSNLRPALGDAVGDTGELYTDGCQQSTTGSDLRVCSFGPADAPAVVLFGDSHAGRWFPALEAAFASGSVRVVTLTKSGCRSLESSDLWDAAENRSCAEWRASAVEWLRAHPPRLLVLADHLGRADPGTSPHTVRTHWREATGSTLARFPAGVSVAVLAETPEFDFNPPACLSRHLGDADACSEARSAAVNTSAIEGVRAGVRDSGAALVDLTDWFCNPESCPTVIGSALVYTDEHHLSATFSARLGPALRDALEPLLATRGS